MNNINSVGCQTSPAQDSTGLDIEKQPLVENYNLQTRIEELMKEQRDVGASM